MSSKLIIIIAIALSVKSYCFTQTNQPGLFSDGTVSPASITNKEKIGLLFMSYVSRERGTQGAKTAAEALNAAEIKAVSYISPETAHDWITWRRSFYKFAPLIVRD